MRKRFICGLTAVCIIGVLITNMVTTASAVVTAAVVGASVAGSLLFGALFNQMTGGQGYDFTDAFQDAVKLYTDWEETFDGSPNDPIHPVTKVEVDISKVKIPDDYRLTSFGGTSADKDRIEMYKMLQEMQNTVNEGLEDGSIEISFDEEGNISMPTLSWCNTVNDIYESFGIYKSKSGTNRVQTLYGVVSPYIFTNYNSWSVTSNVTADYLDETYGSLSGKIVHFVPYFVANDELYIYTSSLSTYPNQVGFYNSKDKFSDKVSAPISVNGVSIYEYYDTLRDYLFSLSITINLNDSFTEVDYSVNCPVQNYSSEVGSHSMSESEKLTYSGHRISDFESIQSRGFLVVGSKEYLDFKIAAQQGTIEHKKETNSVPLTGVENTIGNMGLEGVGSGTKKGTVSVNSKTKDITVTNDVTKEAELVIEQGKPGDIDIPDNDTIIDKFPFSLPFDLYRILTIFVVPEEKPIFKFPIETTITNGGLNYKIDEELEVDLTRFQFMGQDIIRLVLRSTFYVGFVLMLIHVTSKFIKH